MLFEEFLAEIKSSMEQYNSAGLIDDISVHSWIIDAMNELGCLTTTRIEDVISIKNNKGSLPEGFKSLYIAVKCEPHVYTIDENCDKDILQDIYFYGTREIVNSTWLQCDPCDVDVNETLVVEKFYLHNGLRGNKYYNNVKPLKLKLTPYVKRTKCDKDCANFKMNSAVDEISINNKTIYTNFKEGNIFIIYNGYDKDEEGYVIIPDTPEENVYKYVKAYVKREIIKKILENSDNTTNEQFLYSLYENDVNKYISRASGEIKMGIVLKSISSYKNQMKKEFSIYNFGTSLSNNNRNLIDFIVL